jgi:capsular polysaccharide biosynthesis protein
MELEKSFKKISMNRNIFSAKFLGLGLVFSIFFFVLALDLSKTYSSEISILVSAKSQVAAKQQQQIVSNLLELPKTLAFYDRMLKTNPDMRDVTAGESAQQRKAKWNEMLSVQQASFDSSVIKISITASHQSDSVQLASKTVRTLFDSTAFYYDVKNDLSLRIIDGPITKVQIPNLFLLLLESAIAGFAVAGFLQYLLFTNEKIILSRPNFLKSNPFSDFKNPLKKSGEKNIESLNELYDQERAEQPFVIAQRDPENFFSVESPVEIEQKDPKIQEMKKLTKQMEPDKYPNFPEMPVRSEARSGAPDNLPIADDSFLASYVVSDETASSVQSPVESQQQDVEQSPKEPTPEQLKERLNQLLRGEF